MVLNRVSTIMNLSVTGINICPKQIVVEYNSKKYLWQYDPLKSVQDNMNDFLQGVDQVASSKNVWWHYNYVKAIDDTFFNSQQLIYLLNEGKRRDEERVICRQLNITEFNETHQVDGVLLNKNIIEFANPSSLKCTKHLGYCFFCEKNLFK